MSRKGMVRESTVPSIVYQWYGIVVMYMYVLMHVHVTLAVLRFLVEQEFPGFFLSATPRHATATPRHHIHVRPHTYMHQFSVQSA